MTERWTYQRTVELANEIIGQYDAPLTIRQIYYRLVANHGLPNNRSSYNGMDQKLTRAREIGDIDYTRIEDRHRQVLETNGVYEDSEDFYDSLKNYLSNFDYSLSIWNDQPVHVEVWIEKDALSRLIWDIAREYQVTVCPSRGYGSFSYLKKAIDDRFTDDKETIILDFRDHDPSGLQMTEDLERRMVEYSGREVTVKRIALNIDQVRAYDLPPNPVKRADSRTPRYAAQYGSHCWELDALPPDALQDLVRQTILQHIDRRKCQATKRREKEERDE